MTFLSLKAIKKTCPPFFPAALSLRLYTLNYMSITNQSGGLVIVGQTTQPDEHDHLSSQISAATDALKMVIHNSITNQINISIHPNKSDNIRNIYIGTNNTSILFNSPFFSYMFWLFEKKKNASEQYAVGKYFVSATLNELRC